MLALNGGLRVKIVTAITAGLLLASMNFGAHAADVETARRAAHAAKEAYWGCLASTMAQALARKLPTQDFVYYVKGACPDEARKFRVAMIDFLSLKHPDVDMSTHWAGANTAITAAQDNVVSGYIERRASQD
jgi:hypothetical protein